MEHKRSMYMDNTDYTAIEDISINKLEKYCKAKKLNFDLNKNYGKWGAFAYYYGEKENLKNYQLISFTNMITMSIAHMKIENISENYIDEEAIGLLVFEKTDNLVNEQLNDEEKTRRLFQEILEIYKNPNFNQNYEILKFQKTVKLSWNQMDKISKYPGDDFNEKIMNIINQAPEYSK